MGAAVELIWRPVSADLAAATYRSDLFTRVGFTVRDHGWYAAHGHYLPGYSLLSPALGALLGLHLLLALSAIAASTLFGLLATRLLNTAAARVAAIWFAVGFCVELLSGRVPFDLGFAIGLGSLLALVDRRTRLAVALAVLTSVASPIAGAFLALAALAVAIAAGNSKDSNTDGPTRTANTLRTTHTDGLRIAAAALVPIVVLALAFPEGGWEPFAASAFWPAFVGVLLIAALLPRGALTPQRRRTLRVGAALYALALLGAFAVHTPVGGNAVRLGALLAGPLLTGVLWERHRRVLLLLLPALLYWQLVAPIRDVSALSGDPSVRASYYAPLLAELRGLTGGQPTVLEIPLTSAHWEAAWVPGHDGVSLARGWERQLDTRYAAIFYRPGLTATTYRTWLAQNGVDYIALPDVGLDYAGHAEGKLLAGGLPYLHEVWRSRHWRLFERAH